MVAPRRSGDTVQGKPGGNPTGSKEEATGLDKHELGDGRRQQVQERGDFEMLGRRRATTR